jgi:hypothetical protein
VLLLSPAQQHPPAVQWPAGRTGTTPHTSPRHYSTGSAAGTAPSPPPRLHPPRAAPQVQSQQAELDKLAVALRQVERENEEMQGEIAATRRAAYAAEEAVGRLEKEKLQQDLLVDGLQVGGAAWGAGAAGGMRSARGWAAVAGAAWCTQPLGVGDSAL